MTVLDTPSGRVRGRVLGPDDLGPPLADGCAERVDEFRGIPYGRPPVGPLRFRRPVPVPPWTGVRDALDPPARCTQPASMLAPAGEPESEDCLALNVWTPDPDASLPVMVWVHGGSFTTGSSSIAWYDGARLAARGIVVVSINYRLGAFGFLHLASVGGPAWAGSTNLGLADQELAFQWVRDNIAAFGGDPSRVTLVGESAGAMSISAHLGRPSSAGLFARAIVQSGATRHCQSAESAEGVTRAALDELGLGATELDRLIDIPAGAFIAVAQAAASHVRGTDLPLPFRPTVDGVDLPRPPIDAIHAGVASGVPLLTGTTLDEMNLFRLLAVLAGAPPDLDDERLARRVGRLVSSWGAAAETADVISLYRRQHPGASNGDLWSAVQTDTIFRLPMIEMVDAHVAAGGDAHTYLFTHPSTAFGGAVGAAHAVEIPFVFDNLHRRGTRALLGEIDENRRRFAADIADRWVGFVCGRTLTLPGSGLPWPAHEPAAAQSALLDVESSVAPVCDADVRRLWGMGN